MLRTRWLILIIVFLAAAVCLSVPCYFIYMNSRGIIVDELGNNAIDIAVAITAFVEKDIDEYNDLPAQNFSNSTGSLHPGENEAPQASYSAGSLTSEPEGTYDGASDTNNNDERLSGGTGTPPHAPDAEKSTYSEEYFDEIIGLLEKIQRETGAAKIYTEKKLSDTKKGYVFKKGYVPENRFLSSDMTEEEILAFNEGANSSTDVLSDESLGEYIRGYAPIVDIQTNRPVGVVVVEFALADAVSLTSEVLMLILICFVTLTFLATVIVYRLALSRMKYLSKDVLTELCNKRYFEKNIKKEIAYARNLKRPLSLMMMDVDSFKSINDSLGHMTGDMVLKAVSGVLLKCTRRGDICCRYGGDEFVVTLPGTDRLQAAAIAERIRQEVCALRFESANGPFGVTLSIGVAELDNNMTADKFKDTADKTLYYSKNTGRNRITVYNNAQNISI